MECELFALLRSFYADRGILFVDSRGEKEMWPRFTRDSWGQSREGGLQVKSTMASNPHPGKSGEKKNETET